MVADARLLSQRREEGAGDEGVLDVVLGRAVEEEVFGVGGGDAATQDLLGLPKRERQMSVIFVIAE